MSQRRNFRPESVLRKGALAYSGRCTPTVNSTPATSSVAGVFSFLEPIKAAFAGAMSSGSSGGTRIPDRSIYRPAMSKRSPCAQVYEWYHSHPNRSRALVAYFQAVDAEQAIQAAGARRSMNVRTTGAVGHSGLLTIRHLAGAGICPNLFDEDAF
jgi:hypothetical protein